MKLTEPQQYLGYRLVNDIYVPKMLHTKKLKEIIEIGGNNRRKVMNRYSTDNWGIKLFLAVIDTVAL